MTDLEDSDGGLFSLHGKAVLLTGATAGLGERFAAVLHRAGARIALVGRRQDRLDALAQAMPGCVAIPADLGSADMKDVHHRAVEAIGEIDVLVNNAGVFIGPGRKAEDETRPEIMQTLAVNLVAPIGLAQAVLPAMKASGRGSIVNVTSIVAHVAHGRAPQAIYAASKGALLAITREWAAQWSRYGVRVNAIAPGVIRTEITDAVLDQEKVRDFVLRNVLIPRHGLPADLDGALLYLASDASAYVTGQSIIVDGGWTAR